MCKYLHENRKHGIQLFAGDSFIILIISIGNLTIIINDDIPVNFFCFIATKSNKFKHNQTLLNNDCTKDHSFAAVCFGKSRRLMYE